MSACRSAPLLGLSCRIKSLYSLGIRRPLLVTVPRSHNGVPPVRKYQGQIQRAKTPAHMPPILPRQRPEFSDDRKGYQLHFIIGGFFLGFYLGYKNSRLVLNASRVEGEVGTSEILFQLFQYQSCPFCCKVRAFLDYYGVPYQVYEVNPVTKGELRWCKKNKKVPLILAHEFSDEAITKSKNPLEMRDSSTIISMLATVMHEKGGYADLRKVIRNYPVLESEEQGWLRKKIKQEIPNRYFIMYGENKADGTEAGRSEERKWRQWADDVMVHMISPNVYRTMPEAVQAFYQFAEWGNYDSAFGTWAKYVIIYVGASAMYVIGQRLRKKYKLKEDVRESLYDAANEWTSGLDGKQFMGGDRPNLSDLAVYGVLRSMEGLDAFKDMCTNTKIGPWYEATKAAVDSHAGKSQNSMR
ncbi:prostaglandin E synthase 2 [Lingula anatina]|uniref:Prostaglandin E synthase 2 n=1 Tax=Lingula anatina TaxID=7574 RepID=A0A1S3JUG4_LINAN|nr:prostaglandin E synthase 2 [Lingula anatina]|eukprot:XP_013413736.1 prostaglandin E synthase 2 [Lingula anatina]